jgi:hypothetical protein
MENAAFWNVTHCDNFKNRRSGGTLRFHHQAEKNQSARNNVSSGVTFQKTAVFIVTAIKTSNLTYLRKFTLQERHYNSATVLNRSVLYREKLLFALRT